MNTRFWQRKPFALSNDGLPFWFWVHKVEHIIFFFSFFFVFFLSYLTRIVEIQKYSCHGNVTQQLLFSIKTCENNSHHSADTRHEHKSNGSAGGHRPLKQGSLCGVYLHHSGKRYNLSFYNSSECTDHNLCENQSISENQIQHCTGLFGCYWFRNGLDRTTRFYLFGNYTSTRGRHSESEASRC